MLTATSYAHPNIALVKYWGKRDDELNIPATPSLSLTLGDLRTTTRVEEASADKVVIDGISVTDTKIKRWLSVLRKQLDVPLLRIESTSNFPANSGLASSASGFAALTLAISHACDLNLSLEELCEWARRGSASAGRSLHGGFVAMEPMRTLCRVTQIIDENAWDLSVVVAITSDEAKAVGSTTGMAASRDTSPFYGAWLNSTPQAFQRGLRAVRNKDFKSLATIAEASCRQMHALMLSTEPALIYWNSATLRCIDMVNRLCGAGVDVFYTIDAGAHVKAVCTSENAEEVCDQLSQLDGVSKVVRSGIGGAPGIC